MPTTYVADIDTQRRDIDVSREIATYMPDESPWVVLLARARKESTDTVEFIWFDEGVPAWWTRINNVAGYTSSDTNLIVDNASIFVPNDIAKITRTGEVILVTAVDTTTNTITVVRGYGTTAAASIQHQDYILRIASAMPENDRSPETRNVQPVKHRNVCQIFKTAFDQSMSSSQEKLKTQSERDRLTREKLIEHRLDIERAFLFGELREDLQNKRRTTAGILSFIQTNVFNAGNQALTEDTWDSFCEMAFQYGSSTKYFIASPSILTQINRIARQKIELAPKDDTYGLALSQYVSPHGIVRFVRSKLLNNDYAGMGIMVDLQYVLYRPFRDTQLQRNIQENDRDGWKDQYLTEAGFMIRLERCHAVLKNVAVT